MDETIQPRLSRLMAENFELNGFEGSLLPETELFELGLGLDSIDIVELITLVEREFQIELQYDDLEPEHFRTMASLADIITLRLTQHRT